MKSTNHLEKWRLYLTLGICPPPSAFWTSAVLATEQQHRLSQRCSTPSVLLNTKVGVYKLFPKYIFTVLFPSIYKWQCSDKTIPMSQDFQKWLMIWMALVESLWQWAVEGITVQILWDTSHLGEALTITSVLCWFKSHTARTSTRDYPAR